MLWQRQRDVRLKALPVGFAARNQQRVKETPLISTWLLVGRRDIPNELTGGFSQGTEDVKVQLSHWNYF